MTTTTHHHPGGPMMPLPLDQAADLTWKRVSLEADPEAGHRLSADIVHYTDAGEPVISVIHLDNRRHWNLTVSAAGTWDPTACEPVPLRDLPGLLLGWDGDAAVVTAVTETASWQLHVEELPKASV